MDTRTGGLIIMTWLILSLSSCTDNPANNYATTTVQAVKSAKSVENKVNVQEIRKSIQEFYAANGRYPASLDELASFNGMTLKNDKYDYDPATGTLVEKP